MGISRFYDCHFLCNNRKIKSYFFKIGYGITRLCELTIFFFLTRQINSEKCELKLQLNVTFDTLKSKFYQPYLVTISILAPHNLKMTNKLIIPEQGHKIN